MKHVTIELRTSVKLDATLYLVYESNGQIYDLLKSCRKVPVPDYTSYTRFAPKIEDTDYKFEVDIPDDADIIYESSMINFGFLGSNGSFVGPGWMKTIRLSDYPLTRAKS